MTVADQDVGALDYLNASLTNQPVGETPAMYMESLRFYAKNYLRAIIAYVPKGRERDVATERLEESVMWAIKGIALNQEGRLDSAVVPR